MEIPLSSKEFALLEYLIRNQGIVLSKDMIQKHVWSYDFDGDPNIIKVYIRYLRKKVDDDFEKKLIHTIRNYGYVMKEEGEKL
jgi:DNA-binding response OmpR family regulator